MSAKLLSPSPNSIKLPYDMAPGEIGYIEDEAAYYNHLLVMRTYNSLVSLDRPGTTWDIGPSNKPNFRVRLLPKGTEVLLTAE